MTADQITKFAKQLTRKYPKRQILATLESPAETLPDDFAKYKNDPVGFCTDVLGVNLTEDQQAIIRGLPGRVKVNSGHGTGKSFLAACAVLWWFYTRNPSIVVTTAPSKHHVETVLWAEVRLLAMRAIRPLPMQFLPKAAKIWDHPDHWAEGVTSSSGEGFQGRHRPSQLFIFDEDERIEAIYWHVTGTMYSPNSDHGWLAIGNPITTSSQSYLEDIALSPDGSPKWKMFTLSALNHPNIKAQLQGLPPPIPDAVTVDQVDQWVTDWTTKIDNAGDVQEGDVEWPPGKGFWYRPGPSFKARVLGIRPSEGVDTVFSESIWNKMNTPKWNHEDCWFRGFGITIGLDTAAYGDDFTAFHVRSGPLSLYHEARNGWGPDRVATRLKELCREYADKYNSWASLPDRPKMTPIDVNVIIEFDGGLGIGVHSHRGEFLKWTGVTMGSASPMLDFKGDKIYENLRSQMWCEAAKKGMGGMIDVSRLTPEVKQRLRLQLTTPYYENKPSGAKMVESKKDIKKRLGRSPDDGDSLLLSHLDAPNFSPSIIWGSEDREPAKPKR